MIGRMNKEEATIYMANVSRLMRVDGEVDTVERRVYDAIARSVRADYFEKKAAEQAATADDFEFQLVSRWSDRIRNLEDMLFMGFCNDKLEPSERSVVLAYAKLLGISQPQLQLIRQETHERYQQFRES